MNKLILVLLTLFSSHLFAQTADQHIYSGNKLYAQGKYKEAAAEYQKAYETKKNREAQYNLGNALYQQKDYEKAAKQFEESAKNSKDKSLKSFSNHNIGNTYADQKKWDEAINYYKQSLKVNPNSADTKYNLAYAQKMKQQQDKQDKKDDK
ncbi:MAG TPA: tetratricopeptide repeat protein, partial [Chitinophagaceae bacterium]|nr:tetratricopeptide repeat protein [Chitinophagaceae bacterium]